jgi:hypothetical protein
MRDHVLCALSTLWRGTPSAYQLPASGHGGGKVIKELWSSGEVAKEKGCTLVNINRIVSLHKQLTERKFSMWVGSRRLFTKAGLDFILTLPDNRRKG